MNYKEIMELTEWLEKSSFTAYSLTINGVSLSVSKQQAAQQPIGHITSMPAAMPAPMPIVVSQQNSVETESAKPAVVNKTAEGHIVRSPIVGTYYESSSPENPAFVKVGQKVKKGDVLCILEAMKIMNEITSDVDGTVLEIFASNGDMAEARMPLFRIDV